MKKIILAFLTVFLIFAFGCEKKPVATVNGEKISEETLQMHLKRRVRQHEAQGAPADQGALRKAVLEELISEKLLLQGAKESNIAVSDEEVQKEIDTRRAVRGEQQFAEDLATASVTLGEYGDRLREKMLLDKFVNSLVPEDSITEEEMKAFYKNSPTPFLRPEEVYVAFIQVSTEDAANAVVNEIKKEKDFDKVAERLIDEKRAVVSQYGWTSPNVYSPKITEAMKNMKEGEFSGPFPGSEGYYIIRLKERRPEGVKSYEEAKEEIRNIFLSQRRQAALIHWVANKRKTANIIIN